MATLILADGTRLDGEVPLSHAFVARALPGGAVMLDSTSASGDDGEIADLSAYYRLLGNVDFTTYGQALFDSVRSEGAIISRNGFQAWNDPDFDPAPFIEFGNGAPTILFSDLGPVDLIVARSAAGVFSATMGVIRADELGGASKNSAYHLARANHTGTQAIGTITGIVPLPQGGTNADNSSQAINLVFASPGSGGAGAATWRALVPADIPNLDAGKITSGAFAKAQQHAQTAYLDAAQTFTANQRIDGLVGIGVAATSSTGFNCRPTAMSGTTQIGATYAPAWTVAGTTEEVGLQISGVGAASGSPYTTTDVRIAKIQAPTRGSNQTITNLTGLRIDDISGVTAGSKKAVDAASVFQADYSSTTDDTRFLLWDVTAGSMKRVSRGASDSGGTGFRLLRIPN